jgi:hypothetical protein
MKGKHTSISSCPTELSGEQIVFNQAVAAGSWVGGSSFLSSSWGH